MVAFLYTEGIQLTAAHSGGRCSDLNQEVICFFFSTMPTRPSSVHQALSIVLCLEKGVLAVLALVCYGTDLIFKSNLRKIISFSLRHALKEDCCALHVLTSKISSKFHHTNKQTDK